MDTKTKKQFNTAMELRAFLHVDYSQDVRLIVLMGQIHGAITKMHLLDWDDMRTRKSFKRWFNQLESGCLICSLDEVLVEEKIPRINFENDPWKDILEKLHFIIGGLMKGEYLENYS